MPGKLSGLLLFFLSFFSFSTLFSAEKTEDVAKKACINRVLPPEDEQFRGVIGRTYKDSRPDFPKKQQVDKEAPNVLVILLDDVGFGQTSTFGGPVATPTLEKLAKEGLRYNQFHTTALCSPTRAALLTGRNHHSSGTGVITEFATGYPGYTGSIPASTALVSEVLRQNGYSTSAFGKWHNTPDYETSVGGPFDRWPTKLGFDYFYGFLGGETDQWHPAIYENTVRKETPKNKDYILTTDQATKAIRWLNNLNAVAPDKPFFMYYAPGAAHAPHHVPKEWIDKYKGQFDQGWDEVRKETLARQKKLGVVPENTILTERPKEIPAWDSLNSDQKKLYARMQEVFAAYLSHADFEIGRIIEELKKTSKLDNTLIIFIAGDNGPSAEGSLTGTVNELKAMQQVPESVDEMLNKIDELGGPTTHGHYPVGWAWAGSSPLKWVKQIASHFGGTRNGMVISWPKKILDHGGLRSQFHHVIDIVPTILEAAGICEPTTVNGVKQKPMEGISMVYTFDDPHASSKRKTQYFEMFGNRALYHDGWVAAVRHGRLPWQSGVSVGDFDDDAWELYNIDDDFSEAVNLAQKYPKKLQQLKDLWWAEAGKYDVLPLDDRFVERADVSLRPSYIKGKNKFVFRSGTKYIPEGSAPDLKNKSFSITALIEIPKGVADGVLVAQGGQAAGWSFFIINNKPTFVYNYFNDQQYVISSDKPLDEGKYEVKFTFDKSDEQKVGAGGIGTIYINQEQVAKGKIEKTIPFRFSADETFDIGEDTGTAVSDLYKSPFSFKGTIDSVTIELAPLKNEKIKKLLEIIRSKFLKMRQ